MAHVEQIQNRRMGFGPCPTRTRLSESLRLNVCNGVQNLSFDSAQTGLLRRAQHEFVDTRQAYVLLITAFLLASTPSAGPIYKWVDEKGVTHYSEKPPPGIKTPLRQIESPTPRIEPEAAPLGPSLQEQEQQFQERQRARQSAVDEEYRERQRAQDSKNFLSTVPVPGQTIAEPGLQQRVLVALLMMEGAADRLCVEHRVVDTNTIEATRATGKATERWTVNRCGQPVHYRVMFQCPAGLWMSSRCSSGLMRE
ncbi:MAG: DUF4124 domain-containing protein [Betaproteobacteria bacterium]|nr:MAG: DUF4124 domain-containing protein [Betaproteobacteria bacterium]